MQKILSWKKQELARKHDIRRIAQVMTQQSELNGSSMTCVIGPTGSGKSKLMETLAHIIHVNSTRRTCVSTLRPLDMKDPLRTLIGLPAGFEHHVLVLDDLIGYPADNSRAVMNSLRKLRSLRRQSGDDSATYTVMLCVHYAAGNLRDELMETSDFWLYPEIRMHALVCPEEMRSTEYNQRRMAAYQEMVYYAKRTGVFEMDGMLYDYRAPFAPVMFYDGHKIHQAVYPLRNWISPDGCGTCDRVHVTA